MAEGNPHQGKKILVADDQQEIRDVVIEVLKESGYEAVGAINGKDAVDKARAIKPHLILMDVTMPEMDGLEALQAIKSDETLKHIPVIMMTGAQKPEDVSRAMELMAERYIPKPFEIDQLLADVERTLAVHYSE
ncbi:MAG: response regulator [Candidatus Omnitrophota bacterium]|nr:response regulator [Candidatus Omnitrophota bacterium]